MTYADFYLITSQRYRQQPLLVVCEQAQQAFERNQNALIIVDRAEQATTIDDLLWAFDPEAYVPHQQIGQEIDDEITPILITTATPSYPARSIIINLSAQVWTAPCERVIEVIPADPACRDPSRQHWRYYQAQGFTVTKYDI